ncbi:hypothetical protein C8Q79DRAFT_912685 [Trametes meyenii]|nr:hypothetical protein C8Q79DRAFT_912685 [Trametes meyenii]
MLSRASFSKVCPCVGGRCLSASRSPVQDIFRREYSSAPMYVQSYHSMTLGLTKSYRPQSIFSPNASAWDHVFEDIKDIPPPVATPMNPRSLKFNSPARYNKPIRPEAATARETQVINDMFASVFEQTLSSSTAHGMTGLGRSRKAENPLFSKLRSNTQRLRWTTEADQELDRKKEEMELCETDMQLLEWAMREVFGESQRYEAAVRSAADNTKGKNESTSESPVQDAQGEGLQLQPSSYPHLLAALMRTFRDKYKDPHLALSMFDHARHLSIASFVFGCTTPAYNELIETRWRCFRDLRGVVDALEEMRVNGIEMDSRTRLLGESIRREVGERNLWQEESSIGSGEVWEMVARLEQLTVVDRPRRRRFASREDQDQGVRRRKWTANQESWKRKVLEESSKEKFHFDRWAPKNSRQAFSLKKTPGETLRDALLKSVV